MIARSTRAIAVSLQFLAAAVMAQVASDKDGNAHHYQGGPQTGVPHLAKHPKTSKSGAKARTSGGHHYGGGPKTESRSEEHTSELQSHSDLVCRLLLEKKKTKRNT